jgi:hypothetical protein
VSDQREVIPSGRQPAPWYLHLIPVARFLIEARGHMPLERPEKFGFTQDYDGFKCHLSRNITEEDWVAINEHFVVPENLVYFLGRILDQDNSIELIGYDTIDDVDGEIPIEVWEERQRAK